MKKEIKDYLHLYYNADCKRRYFSDMQNYWVKTTVASVLGRTDMEIKLILRPLSDVTEIEHDEWSKISTPIGEMSIESAQQIHWAKRLNYYRSIGIDCDELIESGLAIDKKILNNEKGN